MTSPDSSIVLLGLSGSGKTNFLVALDVVLDTQQDVDGLSHSERAADRAYLQPLKEQWLRGEELDHTSRSQTPMPHHLKVKHGPSNTTAGFYLPDLAGEVFDAHFVTRSFPKDFCDRIKLCNGLLLFVHCEQNANHDIHEHSAFKEANAESGSAAETEIEWRIEDACPQVKIVDLLQFIAEIRTGRPALKVAVIISAWDLIVNKPATGPNSEKELPKHPHSFLKVRWPLLDQMLRSRTKDFQHRVFGVSARGGGTAQQDVERLTAFAEPIQRILVVDEGYSGTDITRPIRWLLGLLNSTSPVSNG